MTTNGGAGFGAFAAGVIGAAVFAGGCGGDGGTTSAGGTTTGEGGGDTTGVTTTTTGGQGGEGGAGSTTATTTTATTTTTTTTTTTSTGTAGGGGSTGCESAADCDDADACTTDACNAGDCSHGVVNVNDSDACTADACDPRTGPVHTPVPFDDGNACTDDSCDPMMGPVHTPVVFDDQDACTVDSCDPAMGVINAPINPDDADACTTDSCDPIMGVLHAPVVCNDSLECTVDTCNMATGCVFTPSPNFATSCNAAVGVNGTCYGGVCLGFTGNTSLTGGQNAAINGMDMQKVDYTAGVTAGFDDFGGTDDGVVGRVNEGTLAVAFDHENSNTLELNAVARRLAVGQGGFVSSIPTGNTGIGWTNAAGSIPAVNATNTFFTTEGITTGANTATYFLGGFGPFGQPIQPLVRRCLYNGALAGNKWGATPCSTMNITKGSAIADCATSATMDVYGIYGTVANDVWFAGVRFGCTGGNCATVAHYNGNGFTTCGGLSGYSGEIYYDNGPKDGEILFAAGTNQTLRAIHGSDATNVWACGDDGMIMQFDGAAWVKRDPMANGVTWSTAHDCKSVWATPTDVFFVGHGQGIVTAGFVDTFLLHAAKVGNTWTFDRRIAFTSLWFTGTAANFPKVEANHVEMDPNGDLWLGGSDDSGPMGQRQIKVVRLDKP